MTGSTEMARVNKAPRHESARVRTTDIVCAKFTLAQVVCPDMAINGAGHDSGGSDIQGLDRISGLF